MGNKEISRYLPASSGEEQSTCKGTRNQALQAPSSPSLGGPRARHTQARADDHHPTGLDEASPALVGALVPSQHWAGPKPL